ncbi:hypothetical protein [Promicromonospora sp. NPDC060271]|uniref:hypothetical protein n=1 Tax=Promicromonospora sp. NPDC060271 TaxID=3347089 RepID=UPI003650B1FD
MGLGRGRQVSDGLLGVGVERADLDRSSDTHTPIFSRWSSLSRPGRSPPASRMILKAAGVEKGSGEPHKTKSDALPLSYIRDTGHPEVSPGVPAF